MRLYPLTYPGVLVLVLPVLFIAYYMLVQRFISSAPKRNVVRRSLPRILLLVCLAGVALTALLVSAANPANGRGPSVAFASVAPASPANDGAEVLRKLEADFMHATLKHGSQGYLSYYADDAVEVPNGALILQGKVNIAKTMGFLDDKDNQLTWAPVGADISASGDLGYTYGTYEFHTKDKDGKQVVAHGKYTSIWKKQKDGSWKIALDMGNGNGPE
jgi:ketosteroid isomerase-like protein